MEGIGQPFIPCIDCPKKDERIKELEEQLDAECRISQMLLANKKKQNKRLAELEAELKKKDELLFAYESVRAPRKEK